MIRGSFLLVLALTCSVHAQGQQAITARSPDGKRLASSDRKKINVKDLATNRLLMTILAHKSDVSALAYAPDGKLLASADGDGNVRLFDAATGKELRALKGPAGTNGLSFSADGRKLEIKSQGGKKTFDPATGKEV